MISPQLSSGRVFKTAWFAKAARKARIGDAALCSAIAEVMQGQAADLGGGVFKKRLDSNRYRSIILARGGDYWIYEYLFAKKDRDNIDDGELKAFRKLSGAYAAMTPEQAEALLQNGHFIEICKEQSE